MSEATEQKQDKAHCRHCGGERWHWVMANIEEPWEDEEAHVYGSKAWKILKCGGCHTYTFLQSRWNSEDSDWDEDGTHPIIHNDQFPPAPSRKPPEWKEDLRRCVGVNEGRSWSVRKLFDDIYAAFGLGAYSLAAMGVRAILDWLVTSTVEQDGNFKQKLEKLRNDERITQTRHDVIYAAFDAGSAAAHRGHSPTESDLNDMLDIMERLFYDLKIKPMHDEREAKKASELKSKTPPRKKT